MKKLLLISLLCLLIAPVFAGLLADEICSAGIGFGGGGDFFLQPVCSYLEC